MAHRLARRAGTGAAGSASRPGGGPRPGPQRLRGIQEHPVSNNGSAEIVIVSGARTPMAEWIGGKRGDGLAGGALAAVSAIDLGAAAARGALQRAGIEPALIDHVVMGNAMQTSGDAI